STPASRSKPARKAIIMTDLLKLAIEDHGGAERWAQISRFRAAASITGAIWVVKGQPGLLHAVVPEGETLDQRPTITAIPWPAPAPTRNPPLHPLSVGGAPPRPPPPTAPPQAAG